MGVTPSLPTMRPETEPIPERASSTRLVPPAVLRVMLVRAMLREFVRERERAKISEAPIGMFENTNQDRSARFQRHVDLEEGKIFRESARVVALTLGDWILASEVECPGGSRGERKGAVGSGSDGAGRSDTIRKRDGDERTGNHTVSEAIHDETADLATRLFHQEDIIGSSVDVKGDIREGADAADRILRNEAVRSEGQPGDFELAVGIGDGKTECANRNLREGDRRGEIALNETAGDACGRPKAHNHFVGNSSSNSCGGTSAESDDL